MTDHIRFVPIVTTTAVLVGGLYSLPEHIPSIHYDIPHDTGSFYEQSAQSSNALTSYSIPSDYADTAKNIETIHKFASDLVEHIEDLDPEFSKVIDENYWDLV